MNKIPALIGALLLAGVSAFAQGINAQVQVTNDYRSTIGGLNKLGLSMSVPDTAYRFDYSFDYSVFDSPYLGAYEFSPYAVMIVPEGGSPRLPKFYLKAGAGYSPSPLLQVVYAPVSGEKCNLSLYQDLHGYLGEYWKLGSDLKLMHSQYMGCDMSENLGANLSWRLPRTTVSLNLDYKGMLGWEPELTDIYNAVGLNASIRSNPGAGGRFSYDVGFGVSASDDFIRHAFEPLSMLQVAYDFRASVAPAAESRYGVRLDLRAHHDSYYNVFAGESNWVSAAPRFIFRRGRFDVTAGVSVDYSSRLFIHPLASARLFADSGVFNLELGFKGGTEMNSLESLKGKFSRFNPSYVDYISVVSVENFNLYAGADGHIGRFFTYALKGGYASVTDSPLVGVKLSASTPVACLVMSTFDYVFGGLDLSWRSERLEVLGSVSYRNHVSAVPDAAFRLPAFSGEGSVVYNWSRRIFAGVAVEGMTARLSGSGYKLPAFADLSVFGEYRLPSGLGVWVKGGNLLNQPVHRIPGYAERGINFSAGISLYL